MSEEWFFLLIFLILFFPVFGDWILDLIKAIRGDK